MIKIKALEEYEKLLDLNQNLCPDMIYNHIMLPGEAMQALEQEKLSYEQLDTGIIFYVGEKDFYKLYFIISEETELSVCPMDKPQLIECILSPQRPDICVQKFLQKLEDSDFTPYVENKRKRALIKEEHLIPLDPPQIREDLIWRYAEEKDIPEIYRLWEVMDIYNSTIPDQEQLKEIIKNQNLLCVCKNGQLCGIARIKQENKKTGSIWLLTVNPAFRRQGIARELFKLTFSVLKERGCTRVIEWCDEKNTAICSVTEPLGFQFDGIVSTSYILK